MIDGDGPKSKSVAVLAGQAGTETADRSHLQIVQDNKRTYWSILKCEEKDVLPLRWVWRTIDKDKV